MAQSDISSIFPLLSRLKKIGGIAFQGIENRGRLAAFELDEALSRLSQGATYLVAGAVIATTTGVALNVLVAAIFWDTHYRIHALAVLFVVELVALVVVGRQVLKKLQHWTPLEATREQLDLDREVIATYISERKNGDDD